MSAVIAKQSARYKSPVSPAKSESISSLNSSPITPAGMVATMSIRSVLNGFLKSAAISLRNTMTTAMSVPRCIIMLMNVIAPPAVSNPRSFCSSVR